MLTITSYKIICCDFLWLHVVLWGPPLHNESTKLVMLNLALSYEFLELIISLQNDILTVPTVMKLCPAVLLPLWAGCRWPFSLNKEINRYKI